jgi:enediyne biosynthesis protein E5
LNFAAFAFFFAEAACKKFPLDRSHLRGARLMADPRLYQIAMLASLLVYGMARLDFDITIARACLVLVTVLGTQAMCDRMERRPANVRSALISGLSLCLLLRTNRVELAIVAAVITIAAKFVIRFRGKHILNPTNGGLVAMLLLTDRVWVSPGQWGSVAFFAFLMACLGGIVVNRASRSDVTYAFIAFYCALLFGRSWYLGEPLAIPIHRLQSGALLLFTFFMISDPKTTPDSRAGRVLFAALVAFGGWYVQFRLFRTNGLLWSLAAFAPVVPLIDRLLPGARYTWNLHTAGAGLKAIPYGETLQTVGDGLKTVPFSESTTGRQRHEETTRIRSGARIDRGVVGTAAV